MELPQADVQVEDGLLALGLDDAEGAAGEVAGGEVEGEAARAVEGEEGGGGRAEGGGGRWGRGG